MTPQTQKDDARPAMSGGTVRVVRNLSAAVVAGIAAWSSYRHMVHVALDVGESPEVAYVLPLSVDGMLVVASTAMVDDRRSGRTVRWSARLAFAVGVLASLASNVAAAQPHLGARIVAAWPALALLLTVELLSRSGRLLASKRPAEPVAGPITPPPAKVVATPAVNAPVTEVPAGQRPQSERRRDPAATERLVVSLAKTNKHMTHQQIAADAGVSLSTVKRILNPRTKPVDEVNGTPVEVGTEVSA